jgi:hypothetical protein
LLISQFVVGADCGFHSPLTIYKKETSMRVSRVLKAARLGLLAGTALIALQAHAVGGIVDTYFGFANDVGNGGHIYGYTVGPQSGSWCGYVKGGIAGRANPYDNGGWKAETLVCRGQVKYQDFWTFNPIGMRFSRHDAGDYRQMTGY